MQSMFRKDPPAKKFNDKVYFKEYNRLERSKYSPGPGAYEASQNPRPKVALNISFPKVSFSLVIRRQKEI